MTLTHETVSDYPDRAQLETFLGWCSASAKRYGHDLSAVLIEPGPLETIADRFGKPAAESTFAQVAEHVEADLRSSDIMGRWDQEELLVILPNTGVRGARVLAERLRMTFSEMPLPLPDGTPVSAPSSFGCAQGDDASSLMSRATTMLAEAKAAGGNAVRG